MRGGSCGLAPVLRDTDLPVALCSVRPASWQEGGSSLGRGAGQPDGSGLSSAVPVQNSRGRDVSLGNLSGFEFHQWGLSASSAGVACCQERDVATKRELHMCSSRVVHGSSTRLPSKGQGSVAVACVLSRQRQVASAAWPLPET